jgi:CBS domain-containing protein
MVKIKNIMKKYVITIGPDAMLSDVAKVMSNNKIGSLVVVSKGRPTGIVTDSDIVNTVSEGRNPNSVKISDLKKKRDLISVTPEDSMMDVIKIMVKNNIKRLPVIENEKLVGIVTEKELLLVSPELVEVLSEKLKARCGMVAKPEAIISGICEECGEYSDELKNDEEGRWTCPDCTNK